MTPTQLLAIQPTLPYMHPSTTIAVHTPTFQYHPAQFPVPQTAPTQYSREMHPEQLPLIPPIEPFIPPYYAPSLLPLPVILPPEVQPVVSSTAAHQIEASTAAAPFTQPSIPSAESPHMIRTSYYDAPLQGKYVMYINGNGFALLQLTVLMLQNTAVSHFINLAVNFF